jgi:hypothetical protein
VGVSEKNPAALIQRMENDLLPDVRVLGTDQRNGGNFGQQESSAVRGRPAFGEIGAHSHAARHVAENAESEQPRSMAWPSLAQTGRPDVRALMDRATANSSPRTATGNKQDDQTAKTKPPTGSCSRILDQSLEPTRARSSRNRPLE